MPKLLRRQDRHMFSPAEWAEVQGTANAPLDALLVDGHDSTAAHRAQIRAMNTARQKAEAAQRRALDPIHGGVWSRLMPRPLQRTDPTQDRTITKEEEKDA